MSARWAAGEPGLSDYFGGEPQGGACVGGHHHPVIRIPPHRDAEADGPYCNHNAVTGWYVHGEGLAWDSVGDAIAGERRLHAGVGGAGTPPSTGLPPRS
jgi:hypothetical protein